VALLVDESGDVNSNLVAGEGTNSLTFTMPSNIALNVESVVATVDNGAGGDTTAKLTVLDQSGAVIAKKAQGDTIDAGATGTATFALRLTDEQAATATPHAVGFYDATPPGGNPVAAGTTSVWMQLTFAGAGAGVDLLDVVNGTPFSSWTPKVAGVYCYMARIALDKSTFAPWAAGEFVTLDLTPLGADPPPANFWATQATTTWELTSLAQGSIYTIYAMRYMSPGDASIGAEYGLRVTWSYAGSVVVTGFVEAIQLA
jgi:hypothetical protein